MTSLRVRGVQAETSGLWRPWIFQSEDMSGSVDHSDGQTVDLQTIDPQHPEIVVSAFLPDAQLADRVVVHFDGLPDSSYTVEYPRLYVHDVAAFPFDELPQPGLYNVSYSLWRGSTKVGDSPPLPVTLADSRGAGWRQHGCSIYGLYAQGLVEAWVTPGPHRLTSGELLIRPMPGRAPSGNVSLDITQQPMNLPTAITVGRITYDASRELWSASLTDGTVAVTRGDLFRIMQTSSDPVFLNFALAF